MNHLNFYLIYDIIRLIISWYIQNSNWEGSDKIGRRIIDVLWLYVEVKDQEIPVLVEMRLTLSSGCLKIFLSSNHVYGLGREKFIFMTKLSVTIILLNNNGKLILTKPLLNSDEILFLSLYVFQHENNSFNSRYVNVI